MIQQEIRKDLFEEMEDKKFIEQADEIICDIFANASLYVTEEKNNTKTYELNFYGSMNRDLEAKLKAYFRGLYFSTLFAKVKEYEKKNELKRKEENEELKLGGEA